MPGQQNSKTLLIQHGDLTSITEAWLEELAGINNSEIGPPGFMVQQKLRCNGQEGVVTVSDKKEIT